MRSEGLTDEPWRHHFLPEFYLKRWADGGEVWRFLRPRGLPHPVHAKRVFTRAVGFQRDLYSYPRVKDPTDTRRIEREFLKRIDDRGAKALARLDEGRSGHIADKLGLVQFVLSLVHRPPGRLAFLEQELKRRCSEDFDTNAFENDDFFRHYALEVFTDLASSDFMIGHLARFDVSVLTLGSTNHSLMTSDRPAILSDGLHHDDAFIMVPINIDRLLILAKSKRVPEAFRVQESRRLVAAVNDAVVRQAESLVIGTRVSETQFVENRLGRWEGSWPDSIGKTDGLL